MRNDILVFDIETDSLNTNEALVKFFGAYSYLDKKYYIYRYDQKKQIEELLRRHAVLVGYNIKEYDLPILKRYCTFGDKILVDLLECYIKKAPVLKHKFVDFKLKTIATTIGFEQKGDIDYKIFQKNIWSDEELQQIILYLKRDIVLTKSVFEYLEQQFHYFSEYIDQRHVTDFKYLRISIASLVYKVICHQVGIRETYNDDADTVEFEGGFVLPPSRRETKGKILYLDFASLYPHVDSMFGLFSHSCTCCTDDEKYRGRGPLKTHGAYCSKKMGPIEELVMRFYKERQECKRKKDPREFVFKIFLNTLYGITGNPRFGIFNLNSAQDCTYIGRECIKHAKKKFEDAGYEVVAGDTDSCFVWDLFEDEERILKVRDEIVKDIKSWALWPQETFDMKIEDRITGLWFFESNGKDAFTKKNYLYITESGKIVIKGRPIIKSNASKVSKVIYEKVLKQRILEKNDIKFPRQEIEDLIKHFLDEDITLAAKTVKVSEAKNYASPTSLQAQIATAYGPGQHILLPVKLKGDSYNVKRQDAWLTGSFVGKGKQFCTVEEFRKNGLSYKELDLDVTWNELMMFVDPADMLIKEKKSRTQDNKQRTLI